MLPRRWCEKVSREWKKYVVITRKGCEDFVGDDNGKWGKGENLTSGGA
jgi:hypothetical protein